MSAPFNTPNQTGLDFQNNAMLNALSMEDKAGAVYQLYKGQNVIDYLVTKNQASRQTRGKDGNFTKWVIGAIGISSLIASSTAASNPANLTITFVDPSEQRFVPDMVVGDGSAAMNQGRVVSATPGSIEVEPAGDTINNGFSGAFAAASTCTFLWMAQPTTDSDNPQSLYDVPYPVTNRTSVMRFATNIKSSDLFQTWARVSKDGQQVWATSGETFMWQRIAMAKELRAIWSQPGVYNPAQGGPVNYSQGFRSAVQDPVRGGVYRGFTNMFTEDQFIEWVTEVCNRQGTVGNEFDLVCGRGAYRRVSSFNRELVVNTGTRNTVGGTSVEGFNTYQYDIAGFKINMMIHPMFTNGSLWGTANTTIPGWTNWNRMDFTMMLMDYNLYPTITENGEEFLPAMEKVYFPIWEDGTEEIYFYSPGAGGSNLMGQASLDGTELTQGRLAVTGRLSVTFGYASNFCYDFVCSNMGLAEILV